MRLRPWLGALFLLAGTLQSASVYSRETAAQPPIPDLAPATLLCHPENIYYSLDNFCGGFCPARIETSLAVICYFWAPWSQPSLEQIAWLNDLWLQYRRLGVVLVGFCLEEDRPTMTAACEQAGALFPNAQVLPQSVNARGELMGLPTIYLLSSRGDVVKKYEGLMTRASLERDLISCCRRTGSPAVKR
jgi:hypothetical protein